MCNNTKAYNIPQKRAEGELSLNVLILVVRVRYIEYKTQFVPRFW